MSSNEKFFVFLLSIPFVIGVYYVGITLFVDLPFMLREGGEDVVYNRIHDQYTNPGGGISSTKYAKGYRLRDSLSATVYLKSICKKFNETPCNEIEKIIKEQGLKVNTYFFKTKPWALVVPNDKPEEVKSAMRNGAIIYAFLMVPLILLLMISAARNLYRRIITFTAFVIFASSAFSQSTIDIPLDSFPVYTGITQIQKASIYEYPPTYSLKRQNLDTTQIPLKYPEEVLLAFLCAKDNSWVDFVSEKGDAEKHYKKPAHYAALASMSPDEMFFEPALKITFPYRGKETTF